MRAVITRVSRAAITINGQPGGQIGQGFLVLLGICDGDERAQVTYLAEKCAGLRVFEDENGKMNKSLADIAGQMMLVSNFTLYANCARGKRPDFMRAARPEQALPLYAFFIAELKRLQVEPITGEFGADMKIDHVNDGPVTIIMDTDEMMKGSKNGH